MHPDALARSDDRAALTDALTRVGKGDGNALEDVYQRTSAKLFGICLRILETRGEAEDALQDIYINVWQKAGSFDPARASPITWLAVIARNRAIDRLRARPRLQEPLDRGMNVADTSEDALTRIVAGEDKQHLDGCIEALEERQAGAIRAAFFGGFTYSELAERQAVPVGTMKSWVRRGLLQLRECLER